MPYLGRTDETLSMFMAQPDILRDPNSPRDVRVDAFYMVLVMEWITNGAITIGDIGVTVEEMNELSEQYNTEFIEAKDRFAADLAQAVAK